MIQVLAPDSSQVPSLCAARVVIEKRSEPASGSVMQTVPSSSPRTTAPISRSRSAPSVNRCRNVVPISDCMAQAAATERLPRASSSVASAYDTTSIPVPSGSG